MQQHADARAAAGGGDAADLFQFRRVGEVLAVQRRQVDRQHVARIDQQLQTRGLHRLTVFGRQHAQVARHAGGRRFRRQRLAHRLVQQARLLEQLAL